MTETACQKCRRQLADLRVAFNGTVSRSNHRIDQLMGEVEDLRERNAALEQEIREVRRELARRAGEEIVATAVEDPGALSALTRSLEQRLRDSLGPGLVIEDGCGDCGDPACDGRCREMSE